MNSQESWGKANWPKFSVYKVEDGARWGLLMEKRSVPPAPPEKAYFYPKGTEALIPTAEITLACGASIHELGDEYGQHLILKELKAYAEESERTGECDVPSMTAL